MRQNDRRSLGDLKENLQWIVKYSDSVDEYITYFNGDYEGFLENQMFQDCCLAKIGQIAECLNRISKNHQSAYDRYFVPVVGKFQGMRDITIHQYENINYRIIWIFLIKERPLIKKAAEDCLANTCSSADGMEISKNRRPWFRR